MLNKQKKPPPKISAAAKPKTNILWFILILITVSVAFLSLASSAALSNKQSVQETIDKISEALEVSETIYQKLQEIIAEEIAAMGVEDDSEPDFDAAEAGYEELNGYTKQLDALIAGLSGLNDDPDTSDGKTVLAARKYLNMIRNITDDMAKLVRYTIDMCHAIEPMGMMDGETDDFTVIAEQIWTGCEETRILMEEIKPPFYLEITHRDMITRITEFRDFGEDFYVACYMEDPLRIYSCVYRMTRIIRMFNICDENLNSDIELQFTQAERRMNGPIAQLRDELAKNTEIIKTAQGGNK